MSKLLIGAIMALAVFVYGGDDSTIKVSAELPPEHSMELPPEH
jgi:hypothetical protein